MDINNKPNRATLKKYFVKNAIPTESNFAELIDGLINQNDDGIVKLPGEPLSLQADGDDSSQKKAINFYNNFTDAKPAWTLSLNPQTTPGWSIGDADGNSKLFIDQANGNIGVGMTKPNAMLDVRGKSDTDNQVSLQLRSGNTGNNFKSNQITFGYANTDTYRHTIRTRHNSDNPAGNALDIYVWNQGADNPGDIGTLHAMTLNGGNVGIGTTSPVTKLDVMDEARTGTHSSVVKGLYVTGPFKSNSEGVEFRHSDGKQGIGFGYNTIYAAGRNTNQNLNLMPKSTGNVGIGTTSPTNKLDVMGDIAVNNKLAIRGSDTWLRLNQDKAFTSGVYTPGNIRVDGESAFNGNIAVNDKHAIRGNDTWLRLNQDKKFTSGVFTPGNFRVDGESTFNGKLYIRGIRTLGFGSFPRVLVDARTGELTKEKDANSDMRLKEDVAVIPDALRKLTALRGVSYRWNEIGLNKKTKGVEERLRSESNDPKENEIIWNAERQRIRKENSGIFKGFIAQEVEKVFPEWVNEDEDGYKTLAVSQLLPVLVEAIKEQQQQIREQQQLIEKFSTRLALA